MEEGAGDRVRVVTFNLRSIKDAWWRRKRLVVGQMAALGADALGLQEVSTWSLQGLWLQWRLNRRRLAGVPPYRHWQATNRHLDAVLEGECVLTRLPIVERDVLRFGIDGRVAQRATLRLPSGELFDFVNTHFANGYQDDERLEQARMLVAWMDGRSWPAVITGDFNAIPESACVALLKERYRSAHEWVHGREPARTQPPAEVQPGEWCAVHDYIFVSEGVGVEECGVVLDEPDRRRPDIYPSDHLGLAAMLRIGASAR